MWASGKESQIWTPAPWQLHLGLCATTCTQGDTVTNKASDALSPHIWCTVRVCSFVRSVLCQFAAGHYWQCSELVPAVNTEVDRNCGAHLANTSKHVLVVAFCFDRQRPSLGSPFTQCAFKITVCFAACSASSSAGSHGSESRTLIRLDSRCPVCLPLEDCRMEAPGDKRSGTGSVCWRDSCCCGKAPAQYELLASEIWGSCVSRDLTEELGTCEKIPARREEPSFVVLV